MAFQEFLDGVPLLLLLLLTILLMITFIEIGFRVAQRHQVKPKSFGDMDSGNNVFGGDYTCNGFGSTEDEFVQDEPTTHGRTAKQDKPSLGECRSNATVKVIIYESISHWSGHWRGEDCLGTNLAFR